MANLKQMMAALRRHRVRQEPLRLDPMILAERALWSVGMIGMLYCLVCVSESLVAHRAANRIAPGDMTSEASEQGGHRLQVGFASSSENDAEPGRPAVIGRVEIPALGLMTPLLAGDDSMSLTAGAGHIPGTALPGGLGTVGIAGHRDTHFRKLSQVKVGMEIRLVSQSGIYHYRVTSSEIVLPEQISVLDIGSAPSLALVTCYPFRFVGHAPKRFIVHAALVSAAPDEAKIAPAI